MMKVTIPVLWLMLALAGNCFAQSNTDFLAETAAQKDARMAWWREARFGMFIHWGLYAVPAGAWNGKEHYGEWIMEEAKIPVNEYEKLAARFNPVQFEAEQWARMAKQAGMKYLVITSKHHDGFCLWDSKTSDYDVMDRTPFRRDILKELAAACQKYGLKLCFYHSIMDWHHPDAKGKNFENYRENYLKPQLRELLQNYGNLGVLWFDGEWIDEWTEPQGRDLYQYVRSLQPNILINNRVGKGRNGMQGMTQAGGAGDFGTPEQEILDEKSALDWESCMTMNNHWGYCKADKDFKSVPDLIWNLIDCSAKGGNYLLNIGPTAEGVFPAESVAALEKMGTWMDINSQAIYGSRSWVHHGEGEAVRYTQGADGTIYAFLRKGAWSTAPLKTGKGAAAYWQAPSALLKKIKPAAGSKIAFLGRKIPVEWYQSEQGAVMLLPEKPADDAIIVLKMQAQPAEVAEAPVIADGKTVHVFAAKTSVDIRKAHPGQVIRYTLDGSEPDHKSSVYKKAIALRKSTVIKAAAFENGKVSSETVSARYALSGCGIELSAVPSPQYAADGAATLLDGQHGVVNFHKGHWLGFSGKDVTATLDFGKKKPLSHFSANFLRRQSSWIFMPKSVEWAVSDDGKNWQTIHTDQQPEPVDNAPEETKSLIFSQKVSARYVRMTARSQGRCPSWHAGAGGEAWLFVDELEVR